MGKRNMALCLLCFAGGVLLGYAARERASRRTPAPEADSLTPEQREQIRRMEEALRELQGYGPETAYGPADLPGGASHAGGEA